MKSTYKLLGVFWDGLPCENTPPMFTENITKGNELHLLLSRLLAFSSADEIQNNLDKDGVNQSIIIDVDFYPTCNNKIIDSFFIKRINQVRTYLSQYYNEVFFVIATGQLH